MDQHREVGQLAVPDLVAAGGNDLAGPAFLGVLGAAGRGQVPCQLVSRGYGRHLWVITGVHGGRVQECQGRRPKEPLHRTDHRGHHGRLGQIRVQVAPAEVVQPARRAQRQRDTGRVPEGDHPNPADTRRLLLRSQVTWRPGPRNAAGAPSSARHPCRMRSAISRSITPPHRCPSNALPPKAVGHLASSSASGAATRLRCAG